MSKQIQIMGICVFIVALEVQYVTAQQNRFDLTSNTPAASLVPGERQTGPPKSQQEDSGLDDLDALLDTDVTQLRNTQVAPAFEVEVSSVSRQKSTIGKSPAAVFVVTQEMIRRSGARSLPELLRQVPGLHVGKIGSGRWSVSSRGFIDDYNAQLLVQIDGRSVYTPVFGGVVWGWHDMLLDDIERIEVVRGPGSTVWGANAVNGVINVITKSSADTLGFFLEGGGGTEERAFAGFRIGGVAANGINWRVSGKWFDRDEGFEPLGLAFDDWRQARVNMRMDWESGQSDRYMLQGGMFNGMTGVGFGNSFFPMSVNDTPASGGNFLFRHTHEHAEESDTTFQVWSDHYDSGNEFDTVKAKQTTLDFELNHRFRWRENHRVIAGVGFRNVWDELRTTSGLPIIDFNPPERSAYNASAFVQDEIGLSDSMFFTVGAKMSYNAYSRFEVQPSLRLLSVLDERSVAWCAVSRAVRVPSRTDANVNVTLIPGLLSALGNPEIDSEPMLSYEVGYRKQPTKQFSWDATLFYHDYNDLVTFVFTNPTTLTAQNLQDASSYGTEISGEVELTDRWKVRSWYSYLRLEEKHVLSTPSSKTSPRHQAFFMSSYDLSDRSDLDFTLRYVDDLRNGDVGSYIQGDLRLASRLNENVELSIVGQNLFNADYLEANGNSFLPQIATQPQRGVYGMMQVRY